MYFIYDESVLVGIGLDNISKAFRSCRQFASDVAFKKIDGKGLREFARKPHRFAGAARTEKEETSRWKAYKTSFHGVNHTMAAGCMQSQNSGANGKSTAFFPVAMEFFNGKGC